MTPTALFPTARPGHRVEPRWHMIAEIELTPLVIEQAAWLRLCDQLEAIADALPHTPGSAERDDIAAQVEALLHVPAEEGAAGLPTPLRGGGFDTPLALSLLAYLANQRAARVVQAQDILDMLDGDPARQADLLGYMLRCFFEGCRHLIMIEQLVLLGVGGARLLPGARALLAEHLMHAR